MQQITQDQNPDTYQVLVTSITWRKDTVKGFQQKHDTELPDQFSIDLPKQLVQQKSAQCFNDNVETFVYNMLTKKFGHEVIHCQIWLPLEENESKLSE